MTRPYTKRAAKWNKEATPEAEAGNVKILERIVKLLALSESPNQAEAESAAAKVRSMLIEYNLSMDDVAGLAAKDKAEIVEETIGGLKTNMQTWEVLLAMVIARAMFARSLVGKNVVYFVGRKDDVEVASYTFQFLRTRVQALANTATFEYAAEMRDGGIALPWSVTGSRNPNTWKSSWLKGAVDGIALRLKAEREAQAQTVTALAVSREAEIAEYLAAEYGPLGKRRLHNGYVSRGGYSAGVEAGQGIDVTPGIKGVSLAALTDGKEG